MIIDIHGHIGTWPVFYIPEPSDEWLVRTNRELGIVSCGVSHLLAISLDTERGNRAAIDVARKWGGDLGVWLVANPTRPNEIGHLEELLHEPEVWGFKFHSDVHETELGSPTYEPFIELAEEYDLPVLAHGQTDSTWSGLEQFDAVAARHPSLKLILGHSGLWTYGFPRAAEIAAANENVFLDTSGSRLTGRDLQGLVRGAGVDKVLFGSDAIFLDQRYALGVALNAPLTEHERRAVLHDNADRLLRRRRRT